MKVFLAISLTALVVVWSLVGFVWFMSLPETTERDEPPPQMWDVTIYRLSKDRIRNVLKAPRTAVFPSMDEVGITWLGNRVVQVDGFVDSQNSFGALIRNDWQMIADTKGGSLDVLYAKIGSEEMGSREMVELRAHPPSFPQPTQ